MSTFHRCEDLLYDFKGAAFGRAGAAAARARKLACSRDANPAPGPRLRRRSAHHDAADQLELTQPAV